MRPNYNPKIHHHRSIRLPNYDYSQTGAYFITICSHQRLPIFSRIEDGISILSPLGKIIEEEWFLTKKLRPYTNLGAFVVMPDHIHGIIIIEEKVAQKVQSEQYGKPTQHSIPTIVRSFKSAVSKRRPEVMDDPTAKIWQSNYYEHIIRNEAAFDRISNYIENNPLSWKQKHRLLDLLKE